MAAPTMDLSLILRRVFVVIFLSFYSLYGLFQIGFAGLLFSYAIGLIAISFEFPIELTTAIVILSGLAWRMVLHRKSSEGFQAPTGTGQSAQAIRKKIEQVQQKNVYQGATGLFSSTFVEGFSNASGALTAEDEEETSTTTNATTGGPASTNDPTVTAKLVADMPAGGKVAATQPAPTNQSTPSTTTSGFIDKQMSGMFKLGSVPPDAVGGSHIDVGTTLMNALNSLKPDQIKQMTNDTKQLVETQKSLVGMLSTIKPMLNDGKQLMETFNGMFGNTGSQ